VSCVEDRLPELVGVQLAHGGSDWGSNGYREPTRPTARWQHSDPRQRERTDYEKGLLDYSAVAILLLATMSQYALARGGGSHGGSGHGGGSMGEAFMDLAAVDSVALASVAVYEDLVDRARALRL
jgi:hypothetical protein